MLNEVFMCLGHVYVLHSKKNAFSVFDYGFSRSENEVAYTCKQLSTFKKESVTNIRWTSAASVFNRKTKLKTIFIFVQFETSEISVYTRVHSQMKIFAEISSFPEMPDFNVVSNVNIAVTDGPTVLFVKKTVFYIVSVQFGKPQKLDIQAYVSEQSSIIRILQFESFEIDIINVKACVYIFVFLSVESSVNRIHIFSIIQNSMTGEFTTKVQKISCNRFFQSYYESVLTSLHIVPYEMSIDFDEKELDNIESIFTKNKTVCCTHEQLLIFQNGYLQHCCNVTVSDISRIIFLSNNNYLEKKYILLQSSTKGVCLLKMKDDSEDLECAAVWENAMQVFVGDFLQNCSQQILLLSNTKFDSWQEGSILLQFPSLSPVALSAERSIPDEHLKTTISSLQKRVVYGKAAVSEAECRIAKKTSVISSILKGSRNQCSPSLLPGQSTNSSLVDIILYKDQSQQRCEEPPCKTKEMALCVVDHWKMVQAGHLFIGWTFQNVSDSCVKNLNASLVLKDYTVEYRQRTFIENSYDFSMAKEEKGHVLPHEQISVVTSMEIPAFICDTIEISYVISWNIGVSGSLVQDALYPNEIKGPCQQQPFEVSLSAKEVLTCGKLGECSDIHQLMSFRTLQDSLLIEVSTVTSAVPSLENIALRKRQTPSPRIVEMEGSNALFFMDAHFPLFGVSMSWNPLNLNTVEAEVYARTETELVLFVQWLYSVLPCDTTILPKEVSRKDRSQLKKKLLCALKEEVDLLNMVFANPSRKPRTEGESSNSSEHHCDENFSPEMSTPAVRRAMIARQLETDNLVAKILSED